ncbi:hypothetical protein EMCG_08935 [[Emmonsia] crescens]|uniref:Aminoglycoside phosphotransferase domain-containing protein n=1 Tax=[Emmonsia] crescens TaxID=73230 RepID=A0A0G2JA72_9EURO|nr:hypothetical protein EMCG_08935 [Emmonsia crescens UAMH 3008]
MASGFDETLLHEYDDSTLAQLLKRDSRLIAMRGGVNYISPNLITKAANPNLQRDAIKSTNLALQLGIRVPVIKRSFQAGHSLYTVMERVDGMNLLDCWHQLGWLTTFKLAFQLRGFVRKMRTQTSPTAGGLHTGDFNSIWVEDLYGLPKHAGTRAVVEYFNFWGNFICPPLHERPKRPEKLKVQFSTAHFVFTHQDLAPRNLMIDKHDKLWLIDWNLSGWFPIYMEYVGMQNFVIPSTWKWLDRLRWTIFSWISVGRDEARRKAIKSGHYWSLHSRLGRYEEVLVEGADPWDTNPNSRKPGL